MSEAGPPGAAPVSPRSDRAVTLGELAWAFLKIALASVGGGLSAWALRVIVEERRWLTHQEFLGALTVCRLMPGPNQVNMAVYVGTRFRGLAGAVAALLGLTLIPVGIVLALGVLYFGHREIPGVKAIMTGLVAAAAGMTLSTGVKLGIQYARQPAAIALGAAAFVGVAILRWPLLAVLAALGPIGIAWYWPGRRPGRDGEHEG
jgi:chromate transporter